MNKKNCIVNFTTLFLNIILTTQDNSSRELCFIHRNGISEQQANEYVSINKVGVLF